MSKENKSSDPRKSGGKKSGKRFGKRRENYVDSFKWGFVQGDEQDEFADEGEFFDLKDERDRLDDDRSDSEKPTKKKKATKKVKKTVAQAEKSTSGQESGGKAARKKAKGKKTIEKVISSYPLFEDEEDEDDLNLPSYGRTPTPSDDELPKPVLKKKEDRSEKKKPKKAAATGAADPPKKERAPERKESRSNVGSSDKKTARAPERPRKEQMVWDSDKREYVPLIVTPQPAKKESAERPARSERKEPERRDRGERRNKREDAPRKAAEAQDTFDGFPWEAELEPDRKAPSAPKRSDREPRNKAEKKRPSKDRQVVEKTDKKRAEPPKAVPDDAPRAGGDDRPKRRPKKQEDVHEKGDRRPSRPQRGDVAPMFETNIPDPADIESDIRGFAELGVSDVMLEALRVVRYLDPTPIQSGVFKQVQSGKDVMGQAQTGTGKTAAFSIPIIEGVEECPPGDNPVALILVPTRELAVQVRDEASRLAYGRDIRIAACYGGKPIARQIAKLRDGVDVIVGTPGRILDLMNRRALSLDSLRWVVLDEADRMLDIGFRPDIEKILRRTPQDRQTLLFSATLPPPVVKLAERYMKSPEILDFSNKGVAVETIEQFYITVDPERKFDALLHLLDREQPNQAIIFTRTKRGADRLARLLSKRLDSLAAIHGDLSQGERDRVMSQFRAGKLRYLVATDVVGRGIDVSGISHIINYDIPAFCDDYVHRVGRTGRMGREGVAYTFVTVQEGAELTRIEMRIDKLLKRADLKGFESFAKPIDTSDDPDAAPPEPKAVYGKTVRKIRRAL